MRGDVQFIFKATPQKKQVMFFSATMPKDIREVARKFMNKVRIIPITLRYFHYKLQLTL